VLKLLLEVDGTLSHVVVVRVNVMFALKFHLAIFIKKQGVAL